MLPAHVRACKRKQNGRLNDGQNKADVLHLLVITVRLAFSRHEQRSERRKKRQHYNRRFGEHSGLLGILDAEHSSDNADIQQRVPNFVGSHTYVGPYCVSGQCQLRKRTFTN